jgi:hypothetical protein
MKEEQNMAYDELVTFEDVEVLAHDVHSLRVRVDGSDVWVPNEHMAITDGVVGKPGDRGRLIVPRWVAIGLGLTLPPIPHVDHAVVENAVVEKLSRRDGQTRKEPNA